MVIVHLIDKNMLTIILALSLIIYGIDQWYYTDFVNSIAHNLQNNRNLTYFDIWINKNLSATDIEQKLQINRISSIKMYMLILREREKCIISIMSRRLLIYLLTFFNIIMLIICGKN